MVNNSPRVVAQAKSRDVIDNSPRQVAQRKGLARLFGLPVQWQEARHVVQRITDKELKERGARIAEMATAAPEVGMNLWMVEHLKLPATIHLLGTSHGLTLSEVSAGPYVAQFLQSESFTHVYSELPSDLPYIVAVPDLIERLEKKQQLKQKIDETFHGKEPDKIADKEGWRAYMLAQRDLETVTAPFRDIDKLKLDDAYTYLAGTQSGGGPKHPAPRRSHLETLASRERAKEQNVKDLHVDVNDRESLKKIVSDEASSSEDVVHGNQKLLFEQAAKELLEGRDTASAEERNKQWVERLQIPDNLQAGDKQLWIVGAAHLPGLILRFQDLGWKVSHQAPPGKPSGSHQAPLPAASAASDVD